MRNVLHSERLFVAGLLHDVGLLVMLAREPELVGEALSKAQHKECPFADCEREVIGCTHDEVGYELLKAWHLPDSLCETVGHHHDIANAGDTILDVSIIHIADVIANKAEMSAEYQGTLPQFDEEAWTITGLTVESVPKLMHEVEPLFAESWAMIQPMVRHVK